MNPVTDQADNLHRRTAISIDVLFAKGLKEYTERVPVASWHSLEIRLDQLERIKTILKYYKNIENRHSVYQFKK